MPALCCFSAAERGVELGAEPLGSEPIEVAQEAATPAAADQPYDAGLKRINPVVRTYLHPGDATSCRRYLILLCAVTGAFMWWLGPVLGIFIVDPVLQLMLMEGSVITPDSNCFDHRLAEQVCDSDVFVDYYFWNLTNKEEWVSGAAPPAYEELGPYAFKAKEVRYDLQYNTNWTEVSFTYHQYAEFLPDKSCPGCSLEDPLTGINRAYLQFLAAGTGGAVDPESAVIYQLTPITLAVIRDAIVGAVAAANPASPTIQQDALHQWVDCAFLQPLVPLLGLPSPYLKDVPLPPGTPGFPYHPELCAYIPDAAAPFLGGVPPQPSDFATYGLALDYTAAGTFLALAIGQSNATYLDPMAGYFMGEFLTKPRATVLAELAGIDPATSTALGGVTDTQWLLLQGYIASLVPTWGTLVMSGWLQAGGGGMLMTNSIETWLYGFEDPLLLTAAQGAAASAGTPDAYRLAPWLYTPSLALTFPSKDAPLKYFSNVTGQDYDYSMLSWNSSRVGAFMPLIMQKRMRTGKAEGDIPQDMLQYRGLSFQNKTWGIINATGISEGVAFSSGFESTLQPLTWDTVLLRPLQTEYTGYRTKVKKVETLLFNMTPASTEACNWTAFGDWAGAAGFDPDAYRASVNVIPPDLYWPLMSNDTALGEYLQEGPLGSSLGPYYEQTDVGRDRCANPELFAAMWDMSSLMACPTIYTFPHYYQVDPVVLGSTGNASAWAGDFRQHGYSLAMDPFTGFALKGHKTYQINHLVSSTANLFPDLFVVEGTAAATGLPQDFVTVPTFWVRMWWEAPDSATTLIRLMLLISNVVYYFLVVSWPVIGWLQLGPALFTLRFSREAKERRRAMAGEQRSRAGSVRLPRHERDMVMALERLARGSSSVELPEGVTYSEEAGSEAALAAAERGLSPAVRAPSPKLTRSVSHVHPRSPRLGSAKVMPVLADGRALTSSGDREVPLLQGQSSSAGSEAALLPEGEASGSGGLAEGPPPSRLGRNRN